MKGFVRLQKTPLNINRFDLLMITPALIKFYSYHKPFTVFLYVYY